MRILILCFLCSCSLFPPKPSDELEKLSEDCLKSKKGIDIQINPVDSKGK